MKNSKICDGSSVTVFVLGCTKKCLVLFLGKMVFTDYMSILFPVFLLMVEELSGVLDICI